MDDPIDKKKQNEELSACITLALNLDNLFKLYSYRCIEPTVFAELVQTEIDNYKKLGNDKDQTLLA